ncbi:2-amino-5-chloromuconate deaminase CnbZ [Paraburkholderia sediminicola]|uniref:2-amino-5-chloromuconate deaminase CnbZ n=1 Tax=Paraburkholderia sediminicola TaxID=458836 RepID=UPI0038B9EFCF
MAIFFFDQSDFLGNRIMSALHMIENRPGNYKILPGGAAYCSGIIPDEGFEVVRVQLQSWLPLEEAYRFIEAHLERIGRPAQAFCGIEMRVPAPLTFNDWSTFNLPYFEQLRKWELMFGDYSGVCRSNIALALYPPAKTSVCTFSYTVPAVSKGQTFLLSGQADIGANGKPIADGDTSPAAMRQRTRYTIDTVGDTLNKLGFAWKDATQIALFHVHDIPDLWEPALLGAVGTPIRGGVLVYRARPPIAGGEVELEARAIRQELVVATD